MRISVKVAPGVRLSGRVGGRRRHRHHHHSTTYSSRPAVARGPWLRTIPPWRLSGISGVTGLFLAAVYVGVWMIEFELWLCVWFYYGAFLGLRWCWRHNPIGQTIDSRAARLDRQRPTPYDPHGAPQQYYDLGAHDQ